MDDAAVAARRCALLATLLNAQAIVAAGTLAVSLLAGLDVLLFFAPVEWGIGFLVNKDAALAIAALLHIAAVTVYALAARAVRTADPTAGRLVFIAAAVSLLHMPVGLPVGAYGLWLARRPDFGKALAAAPALAGRGLRRTVFSWCVASALGMALGAGAVLLLFSGTLALVGLPGVFLATAPQAGLLWNLDRRIQGRLEGGPLDTMPPLPEWSPSIEIPER